MIEEYLSLIRLTKEHIGQHFASNAQIETSLKLKQKKIAVEAKPAPLPPVKIAVIPVEKKMMVAESKPAPLIPLEPKPIPRAAESKKDILPKLKELFPEIKWVEPPKAVIDLIFIGSEAEIDLYARIAEALGKQGICCRTHHVETFEDSFCAEGAKAMVLTKETLLTHEIVKKMARRDEALRPYLGATPLLIAPPQEELSSREQKRSFWDKLQQIVSA